MDASQLAIDHARGAWEVDGFSQLWFDDADAMRRAVEAPERRPDLPVVLLTARVRGVEVDDYITVGADGVIAKPFDPMMLAGEITALWRARRR